MAMMANAGAHPCMEAEYAPSWTLLLFLSMFVLTLAFVLFTLHTAWLKLQQTFMDEQQVRRMHCV